MQRRSSRIKNIVSRSVNNDPPTALPIQKYESEGYVESGDDSPEDAVVPPRKRRKAVHQGRGRANALSRQVKGRRGALQYMNEIPLDIIYEIFGNLEPVDLLNLSWSCKRLHSIVMGAHARFLWVNAFKDICAQKKGPPLCPQDLNFAQYARFLFINRCMICHVAAAFYFSWGLRLKTCWNCLQTEYFVESYFLSYDFGSIVHYITGKRKLFYIRTSVERLSGLRPNDKVWLQQVEQYQKTRQGESEYRQWKWKEENNRKLEARNVRQKAIFEKLDQLGWPKSEVLKCRMGTLPTFDNVAKLTEKEWDRLCPVILANLESGRNDWQIMRVNNNYRNFIKVADGWTPVPMHGLHFRAKPSEFIVHEPFASLIQNYDKKPDFTLNVDFTSTLSKINVECLQKRNTVLFSLLPADIRSWAAKLNEPYTALQSAVVWFHDTSEDFQVPMDYVTTLQATTRVLLTGCLSNANVPPVYGKLFGFVTRPWEMYSERFAFDHKTHDLATDLVRLCGEDSSTATSSKMASDSTPLSCILCEKQEKLTYSTAIQHTLNNHRDLLTWKNLFRVVE